MEADSNIRLEKFSFGKASKIYDIPKSTLVDIDKVKGRRPLHAAQGPHPVLTDLRGKTGTMVHRYGQYLIWSHTA